MEICPACGRPLVPFRAKLVCRTPGCGFIESCCDGGWMNPGGERVCDQTVEPSHPESASAGARSLSDDAPAE